jgi:hypothetical protein
MPPCFTAQKATRSSIRWIEPLDRTGFSSGFDWLWPAYRRLERGGVDERDAELGAELRDEERGAEWGAGREDRGEDGGTEAERADLDEDGGADGVFRPERGADSGGDLTTAGGALPFFLMAAPLERPEAARVFDFSATDRAAGVDFLLVGGGAGAGGASPRIPASHPGSASIRWTAAFTTMLRFRSSVTRCTRSA